MDPQFTNPNSLSERPIAERLQELRLLSKEFGSPENIPSEVLAGIGYIAVREEDPKGSVVTRLMPVEKIEQDAEKKHQDTVAAEARARRMPKAPFEPISFEVSKGGTFAAKTTPDELGTKLRNAFDGYDWFEGETVGNTRIDMLPADHPVQEFTNEMGESLYFVNPEDPTLLGEVAIVRPLSLFGPYQDKVIAEISKSAFSEDMKQWSSRAFAEKVIEEFLSLESISTGRIPEQDAEHIWTVLDRLKARLTDLPELEKAFANRWLNGYVYYESYDNNDDGLAFLRINRDDLVVPELENERIFTEQGMFAARRGQFALIMQRHGFTDVADQLSGCANLEEIIKTVNQAVQSNGVLSDIKQREKALRAHGPLSDSKEDRGAFSAELVAIKAEARERMRIILGMQAYFNLPRIYAQHVAKTIDNLQELLAVPSKGQKVTLMLDPRRNPEFDADPGAFSGDCTAGQPLPFDTELPAFNIKVFEAKQHKGNIYLLSSKTKQDEPVWHLDAIQIPSYSIDWGDFPEAFAAALSAEAEKNGIKYITINSKPHQISNYDYIARSFMNFLGVDGSGLKYDQLEQPNVPNIDLSGRMVEVMYPESQGDKYSNFQMGGEQIILWKNIN
ncbi:MAG: hypothetical protein JWO41_89 [Candidatus Saccharibacteria bacterium]|nr:hypothetical protein [Candidatus Saccharibacteria bacterium]